MLMVLCKMTGTLPGMNQKYQEVLILRACESL